VHPAAGVSAGGRSLWQTREMSGTRNLRETEAIERARLLEVTAYDITLDLVGANDEAGSATFRSITEIHFTCAEPGATTFIEAAAQSIRSATLNGTEVDTSGWSVEGGLILIGLAAENTLVVDADFPYSPTDQGLHRAVDPSDGETYIYTQFEPADAQRVFACFDQPDLKATFTWHVAVPAGWRVVSNMPVRSEEPGPTGSRTVHFEQSVRMSTYINAVTAGTFHEERRVHDGIDLGVMCRASLASHLDADKVFDITVEGLDFFQASFGVRYPLTKYDQVFVPEYSGAMENLGCVIFADQQVVFRETPTDAQLQFRAMVILHEMAHMWFGDLVTMRWWNDLWLNESFATWAAAWALAHSSRFGETAWPSFLLEWKAEGYEGDQLGSTHPVHTHIADIDAIKVNFDRITYGKGASVLKQLVAYVGADAFTTGLRKYFERHAWGNTVLEDLLDALEVASGKPVRAFAAQWLQTAQVNTLRAEVEVADDGTYAAVAVRQEASPEHPTLRTHGMAIGLFDLEGDRLVRRGRFEVEVVGPRTPVPALTGERVPDLLLLNDDDLTYAKVRFDARSAATVRDHLARLPEPLARALCWASLWDMVRDAELPARDFLRIVVNALPSESDPSLVATTLAHAESALMVFADPGWAPEGWQMLAKTASAVVATPSASQRTWADTYIRATRSASDLSTVAGWRAGRGVPEGLEVQHDLRWQILQALVASGTAGPDEIDAEAASDPTVNGETAAMVARALIPTAEAKAAAWALIVDPATKLHLRRGALLGFQHPTQTALTAPYITAYLDVLDEIWHDWEFSPARLIVVYGYPGLQVAPDTLDRVDRWLAERDVPAALRRLISDRRDDMQRALAARARDAIRAPG